jgi:hypothetical protein
MKSKIFQKNITTTYAAILLSLLVTGCSTAPIPVNYAPSSTKSATGSLSVSDFTYLPSSSDTQNKVATNQVRNTAIGEIKFDRDINKFIQDATFSELRLIGVNVNNPAKVLNGEIEEFLIDDLGQSVDWTLRIKYNLTDAATKKTIYSSTKTIQRNTAKFSNFFGALNETVKLSVEKLIDDQEFLKAIQ